MLSQLKVVFRFPMNPLLPRPALMLFAHIASSLYLLEHAIWSENSGEADAENDVEAVRRWTENGDINKTWSEVQILMEVEQERAKSDYGLLFGGRSTKARL